MGSPQTTGAVTIDGTEYTIERIAAFNRSRIVTDLVETVNAVHGPDASGLFKIVSDDVRARSKEELRSYVANSKAPALYFLDLGTPPTVYGAQSAAYGRAQVNHRFAEFFPLGMGVLPLKAGQHPYRDVLEPHWLLILDTILADPSRGGLAVSTNVVRDAHTWHTQDTRIAFEFTLASQFLWRFR